MLSAPGMSWEGGEHCGCSPLSRACGGVAQADFLRIFAQLEGGAPGTERGTSTHTGAVTHSLLDADLGLSAKFEI